MQVDNKYINKITHEPSLELQRGVRGSSDRDGSWRLLVFICVCDTPPVHGMESKRAEVVRMETSAALLDAVVLSISLCFFFFHPCVSALRGLGSIRSRTGTGSVMYEEQQKQVTNARIAWVLPQRFWITAPSVVALLLLHRCSCGSNVIPEKRSCKLIFHGILFAYVKGGCDGTAKLKL